MALFVENNRSLCYTVLWGQSTTLVPNTANRGSDVGKMSPKLMTMGEGWGDGAADSILLGKKFCNQEGIVEPVISIN